MKLDYAINARRRGTIIALLTLGPALAVLGNAAIAQEQPQQEAAGDKPATPAQPGKNRRPPRTGPRKPGDTTKAPANLADPNNPNPAADPNNPAPGFHSPDPEMQRRIDELIQQQQQFGGQPVQYDASGQPIDPQGGQPGQLPPPGVAGQQPPDQQPNQPGQQPGQPVDPNQTPDTPQQPTDDGSQPIRAGGRRPRVPGRRDVQTPPQGGAVPGAPETGLPSLPSPTPVETAPSGPSAVLNIPPDANAGLPPEERKYRFSIKDGTYEQLVAGFARQTGLGVLGEAPKDKLSFVTTEELSFEEALSRVRMLLFNYKPHEPYWLERQKDHLLVIRVTDFPRILPVERWYQSIDAMKADELRDDELVLVIYSPENGSISELKEVRNFLPDYMRVAPLEDQNRVTIFGLVKDIKKYLWLIDFFAGDRKDKRPIEKLEVKNILPSEAIEKVRALIGDWDTSMPKPARAPGPRDKPDVSILDTIPAPPVTVIPEDMQGYILMRAMPEKIAEFKAMLPIVDVPLSNEGSIPHVIKLEHAAPDDIIPTIQQIFGASPAMPGVAAGMPMPTPPGGQPAPRRPRKSAGGGGAATADSVTMMAHPFENALIVMTPSKEDLETVRGLVAMFDVPTQMKPLQLLLDYADANDISNTIMAVLGSKEPGKAPARFTLVSDPSGASIWYSGSKSDLERVREMIRVLDIADQAVSLHYVRLKNRKPTFIANMLREMESGVKQPKSSGSGRRRSSSASPGAAPGAAPAPAAMPAPTLVSKFTADDEQNILFVLCTDPEWEQYLKLIDQLEKSIGEHAPFVRVALQHIDPDTAVARLTDMVPPMTGTNGPVRLAVAAGGMLVIGATPTQLEEIKMYLLEIDRPTTIEQRVFEIKFKDPGEMKSLIETLIGANPAPGPRGKVRRQTVDNKAAQAAGMPTPATTGAPSSVSTALSSEDLTIVQLGSRLIVRAAPVVLDHVAQIVAEFDVDDDKTQLRIYSDFSPGTDIVAMSEALKAIIGDAGPIGTPRKKGEGVAAPAGSDGPRFIPQPQSNKLMVVAVPTMFPRIEETIALLRNQTPGEPIEVAVLPVNHADPVELIDLIDPLLSKKVGDLLKTGELVEASEPNTPGVPKVGRKRTVGTLGADNERYHLAAYPQGGGIVIAAPQKIIDLARSLVEQFDRPGLQEEEVVFKTVALINSDPASMVKSIREMSGSATPAKPRAAKKDGVPVVAPPPDASAGPALTIVEAPTGGAVVLNGKKSEVEQAEKWIHTLDAMTSRGRSIKVYKIKIADVEKLVELILNAVDVGSRQAAGAGAPPSPARPQPGRKMADAVKEEDEDDEFATSKTWTSGDLYIQADLIDRTMLVATTESKLKLIDDIVGQVDSEDAPAGIVLGADSFIPTRIIDLKMADAVDAAFTLEKILDEIWQPSNELPQVTSATFGNALIVKYPKEERFAEIEQIIRQHVDKPDPDKVKPMRKYFPPPKGISAEQAAARARLRFADFDVKIEDISGKKIEYPIEQVHPPTSNSPCVLPTAFQRLSQHLLLSSLAQSEEDEEPPTDEEEEAPQDQFEAQPEPVEEEPPPVREFHPAKQEQSPPSSSDDMIRSAAREQAAQPKSKDGQASEEKVAPDRPDSEEFPLPGQMINIKYDSEKGFFVVEGPKSVVEDIEDWLKELTEENKDMFTEADIRIYRVRYIDVLTAQDIIEEMFNTTRAQMGMLQQRQQQAMRQQQQAQRQPQQPQGKEGQAKPGDQGAKPGQTPAQQQAAQQMPIPEIPTPAVRVYPNPRDSTLILRAETNQYPALLKLLATIDQPKPVDRELKTFHLEKLNAKEVEDLLNDVLGLSENAQPRPTTSRRAGGIAGQQNQPAGPPASVGGTLPKTLMTPTVTGTMPLSVNPQDIKLSSNEEANTIVVMAPKAAIDFIGDLIKQLESEDIADRITKYYELKHASAAETVEQLEKHFAEGGRGRPRRAGTGGGKSGDGASSSGKSLSSPTFVAYDRLNLLTVVATETEIKEIDEIVARLDADSGQEEWHDVALSHGDAKAVADTLGQMFGEGAPSSGKGGASSSAKGGLTARFIGEEGGRVLLYRAPESMHEAILAAIQKLETEAAKSTTIRVIQLANATPSRVAQAIDSAYGRGTSGGGGGGKKGAATPGFTVAADDASKRLFVRADDQTFSEIESLVKTLDVPRSMGFDFRIYPLKYANAREVHTTMTQLIRNYVSALGAEAKNMEAFSVEVNDTANALVVVGGPAVFGFLEEQLPKIDNPAAAAQKKQVVVPLTNSDATAVAKTLTDIFITGAPQKQGGGPPLISISALPGSNAIVVSAAPATFEEIKAVVEKLDAQGGSTPRMIRLQHAKVREVLPTVQEMFTGKGAVRGQDAPSITSNDALNVLWVRASPTDYSAIETVVKGLDTPETKQENVRLIKIPSGVSVNDLAQKVEDAVNKGAAAQVSGAGGRGGAAPTIVIQPDARTQTLIASGPAPLLDDAERIATMIAKEGPGGNRETRIIQVTNIEVEEINALLSQLTGGGDDRSSRSQRRPSGGGNRRPPPSREPAGGPVRP